MGRLLRLALGLWLARWAARTLAAYAARHWLRPEAHLRDAGHPPGWMPHPNG